MSKKSTLRACLFLLGFSYVVIPYSMIVVHYDAIPKTFLSGFITGLLILVWMDIGRMLNQWLTKNTDFNEPFTFDRPNNV